jgi:hypothetical protein
MIGIVPDPDEAGAIAMRVLTCAWCVRDAVDGPPQPYLEFRGFGWIDD